MLAIFRTPRGELDGPPDGGCVLPFAYRTVLTVAQITTLLCTWRLWEVRESPANLPLLPVPEIDMAWPLIACACLTLVSPGIGIAVQIVALAWAIVSDQSRLQPQVLSMVYLTCGTIPRVWGGVVVARASLVALWFFSGVHKLSSPDFFTNTMPWLLSSLGLPAGRTASVALGVATGVGEMAIALACLAPRTRTGAAIAAFVFHGLVAVVLSPIGIDWNREVLPWNVALAFSGIALMVPWRDALPGFAWRSSSRLARFVAVALLASPLGYWLCLVDSYLAHCLYSDNTPRAFVCTPSERVDIRFICLDAGVPVPPAHRLFEPLFLSVGRLDQWMEIEDPRWLARWLGLAPRKVFWRQLVPADAEIVVLGAEAAPENPDAVRRVAP